MNSIADGSVQIHLSSEKQPATPSWLGEVALIASHLQNQGILAKISERVRFARRRFGQYDVLDFVAVLFGYALSGERTLEAFYESVQPFAVPFMALFGRASLPAASTLSRFLAALPALPVETLRTLFLEDLLARRLSPEEQELDCGTGRGTAGTSLISMGHEKRPVNGPYHRCRIDPQQRGAYVPYVPLATRDASEEK